MMDNNTIFTEYVDTEAVAEIAACNLRDAICNSIITNTSTKVRIDKNFYNALIDVAEEFCAKRTIRFYKNDKYVATYRFVGSNQNVLEKLQKFFSEVIVAHQCFYEDVISYDGSKGFCWINDCIKFAIV